MDIVGVLLYSPIGHLKNKKEFIFRLTIYIDVIDNDICKNIKQIL